MCIYIYIYIYIERDTCWRGAPCRDRPVVSFRRDIHPLLSIAPDIHPTQLKCLEFIYIYIYLIILCLYLYNQLYYIYIYMLQTSTQLSWIVVRKTGRIPNKNLEIRSSTRTDLSFEGWISHVHGEVPEVCDPGFSIVRTLTGVRESGIWTSRYRRVGLTNIHMGIWG